MFCATFIEVNTAAAVPPVLRVGLGGQRPSVGVG